VKSSERNVRAMKLRVAGLRIFGLVRALATPPVASDSLE
jgi:hypothetical protein